MCVIVEVHHTRTDLSVISHEQRDVYRSNTKIEPQALKQLDTHEIHNRYPKQENVLIYNSFYA